MDNIKDFVKTQNPDKKWVRTGEAIDAGAKVYGFRVDNVHSTAYRMLNGMARGNDQLHVIKEDEESEVEGQEENKQEKKKKVHRKVVVTNSNGEKTLEKESNLNLTSFDSMTMHQIDPLFKKTT